MKKIKLFRLSVIAFVLSLLAATIPAAPAQAVAYISVSPTSGRIGDQITITGSGFNPSAPDGGIDQYLLVYFSNQAVNAGKYIDTHVTVYEQVVPIVKTDTTGQFVVSFNVPATLADGVFPVDVVTGTYYLYACNYLNTVPPTINKYIWAVAPFAVTTGKITLFPENGPVDTPVTINGTEFPGNRNITVKYDGNTVPVDSGNTQTDSIGSFRNRISIPESTAGFHSVAVDVAGSEITANFTVEPEITLDPVSGEIGTTVIVSGTGFGRNKEVDILFRGNIKVAVATTNVLGSFLKSFIVPDIDGGIFSVDAIDANENLDKAMFTLLEPQLPTPPPAPPPTPTKPPPSLSISTATGNIGEGLVMGGAGFNGKSTIIVTYDDKLLATTNADSLGVFAVAFTVPVSRHGNHTITASDGASSAELFFTVESIPPPLPSLVMPEMNDRVQSPVSFDWKDVADDSQPVTYTLQVATAEELTPTSIVLEKTGLAKSAYTVSVDEQARLASSNTPYYWRVKAVDAASNEGNWTNARLFYVTSPFPMWAIGVIIFVCAVLLFVLGYVLRMRKDFFKRGP